ncbi:benzoate 1,2-dioxygenase electron transfer component BenC [Williamsia sp.]|uniref:benzoate 1,2-dioxygenase electron transfer component BenC n=1 Tax=Williamsia sp. TaxID=1872085 RepID=UPI002F9461A8
MTTTQEQPTGVAGHQIALAFEDGVTRFITCREDQTVADASYRQRINIPLDCRDGACGTCKALCESGEYDGGTYIEDALSQDEAASGYALPCSMKPRSDLVLQIAATSAIAKTQAATFESHIVELERLSPTTVRFGVEVPNRSELAFLPGQYVNISVPDTDATRSYSFSNNPDDERLSFLVKLTPGGAMSDYLTDRAQVGDTVTFTGPHGSFFLRESERPILLLAGGTGLAPILSMLRTLASTGTTRSVHLIYGVSSDDDIVETSALDELSGALDQFTWDHCVSDPASEAANKGYVTGLIGPQHLHDGDVALYLCGPPPMVESVRKHVKDAGIDPTGFYYEKFALASTSTVAPTETESPAEESIVDDEVVFAPDARTIAAQTMLPSARITPWTGPVTVTDEGDIPRRIAGQNLFPADVTIAPTLEHPGSVAEKSETSTPTAPTPQPVSESPSTVTVGTGGYQIGEDHPDVHESDAIFAARCALELGALEVTLGRLNTRQLAGYRLLAESTVPYVSGDHFVDAVETGDRETARSLIVAHADRSKQTMRRAMADRRAARAPRFVTPGRFAGQVVVVTGAAQGIGEQAARRISAEDGLVVLVDRSELVKEVADDLTAGGANALAVTADLETWEGAESVVHQALSAFGQVDVLINNVGGAINFKPFVEFTDTEIRAELDRSLLTTLYSCRAALPSMVDRGRGVIVNVSSAATRGINRIPYSAAKGGINAITASLAMEYADAGIRVVATAPGGTEAPPRRISRGTPEPADDTQRAWLQAHVDQTIESSLMKRYGTLDEQAAAICFLASDEASYITGTVLPVAGGDGG